MDLKIGMCTADITPEDGSVMGCFSDQPGLVRCSNTIVICTLYICMIRESDVEEIRDILV